MKWQSVLGEIKIPSDVREQLECFYNNGVILLLCLRQPNIIWTKTRLADVTGISYVYVHIIMSKFEKWGWIKLEHHKKNGSIALTSVGMSVSKPLQEMVDAVKQNYASPTAVVG